LPKMLVVLGKVRIWKILEAALEYAHRACANRSLKQIRAVFVDGPGAHNGFILKSTSVKCALREFCVNQLCTVMHSPANQRIGRPGNSLINKAQEVDVAD
jgi:hypothetical protein